MDLWFVSNDLKEMARWKRCALSFIET